MKKIDKSFVKEKWVKHPDDPEVEILVRPFPLSNSLFAPSDDQKVMKLAWEKFNYSIMDWKGFVDQDDKPIECNEENKKFIFDYDYDTITWASAVISDMSDFLFKKSS